MKQSFIIIAFLFLFSCPSLFGQVWTHTFNDSVTINYAYRILPMPDSTMLVLINERANPYGYRMKLSQITQAGEVIMEQNLGEGLGLTFIQTYDDHFLVAGAKFETQYVTQAFAMKLSMEGNILWEHTYESGYIMCAVETPEHNLLLGGNLERLGSSSNSILYKTNEDGELFWDRDYDLLNNSAISTIFQLNSGQLLLIGDVETIGVGTDGFFLAEVSPANGNLSWKRTQDVGHFTNSMDNHWFLQYIPAAIDEYGQIIIACAGIRNFGEGSGIYKYSLSGEFIERIPLVGTGYQRYPQDLLLDEEGNYLLVGTQRYHRQPYIPYVEKMPPGGVVLFSHQHNQPGRIFNVHQGTEGDLLVCGSFDETDSTTTSIVSRKAFISRLDTLSGFLPGWIEGKVFLDDNYNCQWDSGEVALPHWPLSLDTNQHTFTNEQGLFSFPTDTGVHTLSPTYLESLWQICNPNQQVSITNDSLHNTIDFAVQKSIADCPLLEVGITQPDLILCATATYFVSWQNLGNSSAEEVFIEISYDEHLTLEAASLPYTLIGQSLRFEIGQVTMGEKGHFKLNFTLNCEATFGQDHCVEARIFPRNDCWLNQNSEWQGTKIRLSSYCEEDTAHFIVSNEFPEPDSLIYKILANGALLVEDSLSLLSNQEITITYPAHGRAITLLMEESPGYPAESHPALSLEGCGVFANNSFSTSFPNMFDRQEEEPWISKSCIENQHFPTSNRIFEKPRGFGYYHFIEQDPRSYEFCLKLDRDLPANLESLTLELMLSPQFLSGTFQAVAWSHPFSWKTINNGRIQIDFQGANLYQQEAFYIRFRMKLKADATLGSFIGIEGNAYYNGTAASPIYLAFFNLNPEETLYETTISPDPLIPNLNVLGRANAADYFSDLDVDNEGNIFTGGTTFAFGDDRYSLYLSKHDPEGQLLWEKTYQIATPAIDLAKVLARSNGYILLLGNYQDPEHSSFYRDYAYCFVMKINANTGEEVWTKSFKPAEGHLGGDIFEAIVRNNGNILFFGVSRNNGSPTWRNFLFEMTDSGHFIWKRFFDTGGSGYLYDANIREKVNGQILLGLRPLAGDNSVDYIIQKFSSSGYPQGHHDFLETETYAYVTHFELTPEGGFYLMGLSAVPLDIGYDYPFYLVKLNADFEKEWYNVSEDVANLWIDELVFHNNHFYLVGEAVSDSAGFSRDLVLIKADTQGDIHWRNQLDFNSLERNARLAISHEGKIWIAAQSTVASLLFDQQIILIEEVDPLINSSLQLPPPLPLSIYPNPTRDWLYYQMPEGSQYHSIYWEILDPSGKAINYGRHKSPKAIPVQKLNAGIYLLRLIADEKQYLGNFIKH